MQRSRFYYWDGRDWLFASAFVLMGLIAVSLASYGIWFACTHECVATDTHWVKQYTQDNTSCMPLGDGNMMCTTDTVTIDAHWETVCVKWGRKK